MTAPAGKVPPTPPVALSIAGSDSGGGAGIAADLLTFAAHRVFGTFAITAVTAQSTEKVHAVIALDAAFVDAQIEAVLGDLPVVAAKTGMLANLAIVELVTARAAAGRLPPLVVDPVMVASSGSPLLEGDAVTAYRGLLPYALVVTPNLPEAEVLTGRRVANLAEMRDAARALCDLGASAALVKGGHLEGDRAVDVLALEGELVELTGEMVRTKNVHGTGCTLSAAIAANLANGEGIVAATEAAKDFVGRAVHEAAGWDLGAGPGPIAHFPGPVAPPSRPA